MNECGDLSWDFFCKRERILVMPYLQKLLEQLQCVGLRVEVASQRGDVHM